MRSRADALRMRFQEIAGTARCVVGIGYGGRWTGRLLRLPLRLVTSPPGGVIGTGVALVAVAGVAGTAGKDGQEGGCGQNKK